MFAKIEAQAAVPSIWRLATSSAKPIVAMNSGSLERNVYCIHSVTGDVGGLHHFAQNFGDVRLYGIQVPKREMTQHLASTIETMAARHVALIEDFQPRGPIHLIGWSAGAIVALEMAQQLRARGRDLPLLVALDGAPCNTGAGLAKLDPRYTLKMIANLPRWIRDDRSSDWSLGGIGRRIAEKLAARRGTCNEALKNVGTLDAEAVEQVISRPGWSPAQKAFVHTMYQAMERYVPRPYLGPVLVFETRTQPLFHLRQVGAAWRAICVAPEIVQVDGNHSGLIFEATAAVLAAEVYQRIVAVAMSPAAN